MEDPKQELASLLPGEAAGWKAAAEDQFYNPDTIFDYIDGSGEVYRSYNFRFLLARRYTRQGAADLIADLFDMGSSRDAFGVFTHDLEGEDAGVGQGSTYKGGLLSFWRDRYFVSLTSEEETPETKQVLIGLAQSVARAIGRDGPEPDLLRYVPQEFRSDRDVHYFHTHPILNYHFFVAADNILGLGAETEAVLAARPGSAGKEYLALIRYPECEDAARALAAFSEAYMPEAGLEPEQPPGGKIRIVQTEDGLWTAAAARDDVVILILQAPTEEDARSALRHTELLLERKRP